MNVPARDYVGQVARARTTARWVSLAAGTSWWAGWIVVVGCLIAWLAFGVSLLETLDMALTIGVVSVLGGVGLYATSRNLELSASRLEIAIPRHES